MKSNNDLSHVSDRRLCCLLGSKFGVCVIFLPVPLAVYQPPCLSFAVSSEGFVNEMSVIKHILTDHIHRVIPRITNRSSLRSLRMCRKDRRVSRRSDYGNDAQLCTSHSGHFFFGSRMSACGIRGRFHRCGVIRGSDRQQCSLGRYCEYYNVVCCICGTLIMFLDRILFARRMMQIWYSWKGGREGEGLPDLSCSTWPHSLFRKNAHDGAQEATSQG